MGRSVKPRYARMYYLKYGKGSTMKMVGPFRSRELAKQARINQRGENIQEILGPEPKAWVE